MVPTGFSLFYTSICVVELYRHTNIPLTVESDCIRRVSQGQELVPSWFGQSDKDWSDSSGTPEQVAQSPCGVRLGHWRFGTEKYGVYGPAWHLGRGDSISHFHGLY